MYLGGSPPILSPIRTAAPFNTRIQLCERVPKGGRSGCGQGSAHPYGTRQQPHRAWEEPVDDVALRVRVLAFYVVDERDCEWPHVADGLEARRVGAPGCFEGEREGRVELLRERGPDHVGHGVPKHGVLQRACMPAGNGRHCGREKGPQQHALDGGAAGAPYACIHMASCVQCAYGGVEWLGRLRASAPHMRIACQCVMDYCIDPDSIIHPPPPPAASTPQTRAPWRIHGGRGTIKHLYNTIKLASRRKASLWEPRCRN